MLTKKHWLGFRFPRQFANEYALYSELHYTVDDWCWEIPAGGVKPGQTPEEAAREELREEIGGQAQLLEKLGQFYTANGICNEEGHYFLATGVTLGPTAHEPAELMEIHPTPIAEVLRMARAGQITDAPSALVIFLCEARLRELQR